MLNYDTNKKNLQSYPVYLQKQVRFQRVFQLTVGYILEPKKKRYVVKYRQKHLQ